MKKLLALLLVAALLIPTLAAVAEGKEEIKLTIYGFGPNTHNYDNFIGKLIYERTGVKLEYIESTPEKTQTMLAGGTDLPDIGNFQIDRSIDAPVESKLLINMDDYLHLMPNVVKNAPQMLKYSRKYLSNNTGGLYALSMETGIYDSYANNTGTQSIMLRWDAYVKAGAPEIKNWDDLIATMQKMLEVAPVDDEGNKTWGWAFNGNGGSDFNIGNQIMTVMGYDTNVAGAFLIIDLQKDAITHYLADDKVWADALHVLFRANQAGVLNPDSLNMSYDELRARNALGNTMSIMYGQYPGRYNTQAHINNEENPSAYLSLALDWLRPVKTAPYPYGATGHRLSISRDCKNIEAAVKVLDVLFDYDALLTIYNGPQGDLWDIVDGKLITTDTYLKHEGTAPIVLSSGDEWNSGNFWGPWGISSGTPHPVYGRPMRQIQWEEVAALGSNSLAQKMWKETYGNKWDLEITPYKEWNTHIPKKVYTTLAAPMDDDTKMFMNACKSVMLTYAYQMVFAKDEAEFWDLYEKMKVEAVELGYDEVIEWGMNALKVAQEVEKEFAAD